MSRRLPVIERAPYELRTVLELVDPPDDVRVGTTFRWAAACSLVRITALAPPCLQSQNPDNVVVFVVVVDGSQRINKKRRSSGDRVQQHPAPRSV